MISFVFTVSQVNGLCRLINQHSRTLTSLEFIHCTLYENFLNTLLDSVVRKSVHKYALQKHGLQHLSIVSSSFGPCTGSLPTGLQSLLSSARYMNECKLFFFFFCLFANFFTLFFMCYSYLLFYQSLICSLSDHYFKTSYDDLNINE